MRREGPWRKFSIHATLKLYLFISHQLRGDARERCCKDFSTLHSFRDVPSTQTISRNSTLTKFFRHLLSIKIALHKFSLKKRSNSDYVSHLGMGLKCGRKSLEVRKKGWCVRRYKVETQSSKRSASTDDLRARNTYLTWNWFRQKDLLQTFTSATALRGSRTPNLPRGPRAAHKDHMCAENPLHIYTV